MNSQRFFSGTTFDDYLSSMDEANRAYFDRNYSAWTVPDEVMKRIAGIAFPPFVLASTEGWCPDCRVNLPLLQRFCLSFRSNGPVIRCHSRESCADIEVVKIPTFIFYDSGWNEVGRWIERPKSYKQIMSEGTEEEKQEAKRRYFAGFYNAETLAEILTVTGI